ncbi:MULTISPECIES: TetR/AcrR family transcriptional regulator [unclassified Sphingopyxis]|uniref:TetR/AcrR family transcriptional regulator n=1 Tax=unclassified Sphingopyxis TaxID=2614943 RepID=UPI0024AD0C70|nr:MULTISPECIES: TetR/AcrR family transcriptional regulator [unclassified Sphingopyxis]
MARHSGTPNRSTAERRAELLAKMRARLRSRSEGPPSWRDLAAAAGVSLSSLTHHFGRREDIIRAVMEDERAHGATPMAIMAEPSGAFDISVRDAVAHLATGLVNADLDRMIAAGLAEGLGHPVLGPAFIGNLLEPMLQAVEARLEHHVRAGEMRAGETRLAAVQLAAPIIVAVLHQRPLGGAAVRPLDLDTLLVAHAEAFVRAWHA